MFFPRRFGGGLAFRAGDARKLDHRRLGLLIGEHPVEVIVRFKILDQSKHFLRIFSSWASCTTPRDMSLPTSRSAFKAMSS